jgi:hypothetical protein
MFAETEVNFTAQFFLVKSGCHKVISLMGTQSNVSGNGNERDENFHEFFLISRGAQCGGDGLSIVSPSNRRKVPTARRSRRCRRRRENVSLCSGLSTGHEKHDGRFAQKACVTSDDIFMWCHKLSLPIQKRSIFYHLGIQSCLSAFGGSLNSTPTD